MIFIILILIISATDSICPKGWEMARYSGNNSYQNLLVASYAKNRIFELSRSNADLGMTIAPLSLQKTGYITPENGIGGRGSHGYIFLSRIYSKSNAYQLTVRKDAFYPNSEGGGKTDGRSIRCVAKCGDATDSICPKGWEMARNEGDRSYKNLLVDIYGKNIIAEDLKSSNGQTDSGIKYLPISFLRAGFLRLIEPHIVVRNSRGDYWIPHISYSTSGHNFDFHGSGFSLGNLSPKGYGYSVRCVAKSPLLFLKKARKISPTSLFYAIIKITVRDIYNLVERRKRWKFLLKK